MTSLSIGNSRSAFRTHLRRLGAAALFSLLAATASAQQAIDTVGPWSILDQVPPAAALADAWVRPVRGLPVSLNVNAMRETFTKAPLEDTPRAATEPLIIALPDPDGHWQRFKVVEYSVMEAPLAAAHPELRTYRGEGIDDIYANIRCSLTPLGFQAQVRTSGDKGPYSGMWHIDAYSRGDTSLHMSYWHADAGARDRSLNCLTAENAAAAQASPFQPRSQSGPTRREYRLALALTGETTVWAGGTTPGLALATNITNQLNGIYETELTVRFVLVASEAALIYASGGSDPFTSPDSPGTSNSNLQAALDSTIGNANYDVGHVVHYTAAGNNNGLAGGIGTICTAGIKGAGYSAYTNPNDAYFVIDYVSHELGHQFGGHHTQSNCGGSGGDSGVYLVEAGSGTTIMSYAGICGAGYNVQAHNDPYFNGLNIEQINNYLNGTSCAASVATGNSAPTITPLTAYAIPSKTPFTLTASATDPDGDAITYCWEQQDGVNAMPIGGDNGTGPIVRSRPGTASPSRTIPQLSTILANTTDTWELLPQVARVSPSPMDWRVTVRDSRSGGGGVNQASTTLQIIGTGPFQITSPNTAGTFGGTTPIVWAVGGSNVAPISCASVKISLSTDGGNTFPTVLAPSVPNTGSANVFLPDINTTTARLKIEAIGNIFFDISNTNFTIQPRVSFGPSGSATIADTTGNGNSNGRIDPGETQIRLTVPVSNIGNIPATGVHGTLTSNTPTATVASDTSAYPDLAVAASGTNAAQFVVSVSPLHPCGTPISLSLTLACDQGVGGTAMVPVVLSTGLTTSSSPVTFTYTGAAVSITDNNTTGVNIPLAVSGVGSVANLAFRFNGSTCTTTSTSTTVGLNHGRVGDLIVKLTSPQGTSVILMNRMTAGGATGGNSGNNFCNTVLDDSASTAIQTVAAANAPFTGTFSPANPLSAFNGEDPTGTWTLNVADVATGTTGTARTFSLVITPQSTTTCTPPMVVSGACCDAAGACTSVLQVSCVGTYQGDGLACSPTLCAPNVDIHVIRIGSGTGTVTSTPSGIDCGTACSASFATGVNIVLNAAASQNSVFVGWSGGPCTGTDACSFDAAAGGATITAEFRCRADFNGIDGTNIQDVFDYLNAWFAGDPSTDFDNIPGLTVPDIFAFLSAWFAGC